MTKPTSHDLMRLAMARHGVTADDLIEKIVRDIGADRDRVTAMVERFVAGGPGSFAVHAAIIDFALEHERASVH